MPIDLQTLTTVRVQFLEARERLLCVIPSPNQLTIMTSLAQATFEFNRGLGISAVRREVGTAVDYHGDALINIEQVTSSHFHHQLELEDGKSVILEVASEIHGVIMKLPLPVS